MQRFNQERVALVGTQTDPYNRLINDKALFCYDYVEGNQGKALRIPNHNTGWSNGSSSGCFTSV
jgi:hypothetical protein